MASSKLERRLVRIVQSTTVLGVLACVIGLFPGQRVYEDSNDCIGRALGGLAAEHHSTCTSSYDRLVETRLAGGWQLIVLVALIQLFGAVVYRYPRRTSALVWPVWTALWTVAYIALTFQLDLFSHVEVLWPSHVVVMLAGAMLLLIVIATPIVALVSDRTRRDDAPSARVV